MPKVASFRFYIYYRNFLVKTFVYANNGDMNWNRDNAQDCEDVASLFVMFIEIRENVNIQGEFG